MRGQTNALWCLVLAIAAALPMQGQIVKVGDCAVDSEVLSLPECAVRTQNGQMYVNKGFLKTFFKDGGFGLAVTTVSVHGHRLAWSNLPHAGWAYFDRSGRIVVKNVATADNGASQFYHGLVRVTQGDKWGLADDNGDLVVPLHYDGLLDYEEGQGWRVCSDCHTASDGEHSWFVGGKWQWLDQHGHVTGAAPDPVSGLNQ